MTCSFQLAFRSKSALERSTSVSSMRRTNAPFWPRAKSQLKSAVRALPTCSRPVGLGAKRTRTGDLDSVIAFYYITSASIFISRLILGSISHRNSVRGNLLGVLGRDAAWKLRGRRLLVQGTQSLLGCLGPAGSIEFCARSSVDRHELESLLIRGNGLVVLAPIEVKITQGDMLFCLPSQGGQIPAGSRCGFPTPWNRVGGGYCRGSPG